MRRVCPNHTHHSYPDLCTTCGVREARDLEGRVALANEAESEPEAPAETPEAA